MIHPCRPTILPLLILFFGSNIAVTAENLPGVPIKALPLTFGKNPGDVEVIFETKVSGSQLNAQMTPIWTQHGRIYLALVEPGNKGDGEDKLQHIVLRQGTRSADGTMIWKSTVAEDRTVYDPWHTPPAVAVDTHGHIHLAYNMHNFPWQYQRSKMPHNIASMAFHGQPITQRQIDLYRFENKTSFPSLGSADIPGNQITYPAFFSDRNGQLHVTYRFAARPKRRFAQRTMSLGLSTWNHTRWSSLGAKVPVERGKDYDGDDPPSAAIASKLGWTLYSGRLMFTDTTTFVQFYWRKGIAGSQTTRPCLLKTTNGKHWTAMDGTPITMPADPDVFAKSGVIEDPNQAFYSLGDVAINAQGTPHVLMSPVDGPRTIARWHESKFEYEPAPSSATAIFFDAEDNLWALATGVKVMRRAKGSNMWETMYYDDARYSYPQAKLTEDRSTAIVYSHDGSNNRVRIYAIQLLKRNDRN